MNWTAFFTIIGFTLIFASLCVIVDYSTWLNREAHRKQLFLFYVLFFTGMLTMATAAGLGID